MTLDALEAAAGGRVALEALEAAAGGLRTDLAQTLTTMEGVDLEMLIDHEMMEELQTLTGEQKARREAREAQIHEMVRATAALKAAIAAAGGCEETTPGDVTCLRRAGQTGAGSSGASAKPLRSALDAAAKAGSSRDLLALGAKRLQELEERARLEAMEAAAAETAAKEAVATAAVASVTATRARELAAAAAVVPVAVTRVRELAAVAAPGRGELTAAAEGRYSQSAVTEESVPADWLNRAIDDHIRHRLARAQAEAAEAMRGASAAAAEEMREARPETALAPGMLRHAAGFVPPGPHAPSQPWTIAAPSLPAAWTSNSLGNSFQQAQPGKAAAGPPVVATCLRPCAQPCAPPSLISTSTASSSASSVASSTSSPPAPSAAIPTTAIPAATIPTAALATTVTADSATASDAGGFAAAAAAQAAVVAQGAAEAQWRFHQQRLAAQQRAKMQAQAALAMAMAQAQQQAAATPSSESGKRPREERGGL